MRRYASTNPRTRRYEESETKPPMALCDFCGVEEIFHVFPAPRHPTPIAGVVSTEGWAACATCADLVRRARWELLVKYSAASIHRRNPGLRLMSRVWIELQVEAMIQSFRSNYRQEV